MKLYVLILSFSIPCAWACIENAPIVKIQTNARVEARAQAGMRLEGQKETPKVISIKQISTKEIVNLKVNSKVTEIKDVRPVYKRILGGTPDYRDVVVPKVIELRPEKVGEDLLEYEIQMKEGDSTFKMHLIFLPGMNKNRGCGG